MGAGELAGGCGASATGGQLKPQWIHNRPPARQLYLAVRSDGRGRELSC